MTQTHNPRNRNVTSKKLSNAQFRALDDFAQPGGHGYGEFAYLSRPTARSLEARGLVTLTIRTLPNGRRMRWGNATAEGHATLRLLKEGTNP